MSSPSRASASARVPPALRPRRRGRLAVAVLGSGPGRWRCGSPRRSATRGRWCAGACLLVRAVHDLAAAATVGLLLVAAFLAPETTRTNRRVTATRWPPARPPPCGRWPGWSGVLFTFAELAGIPLSAPGFFDQFTTLRPGTSRSPGSRSISLGARRRRRRRAPPWPARASPMAWLAALSVVAVLPLALAGHAAGAANHDTAVNALAVHLARRRRLARRAGRARVMRPQLGSDLGVTVAALLDAGPLVPSSAVALSGVQSAWLRLGGLDGLATPYGAAGRAQGGRPGGAGVCRVAAPPHDGPPPAHGAGRHGGRSPAWRWSSSRSWAWPSGCGRGPGRAPRRRCPTRPWPSRARPRC